MNKNLFNSIKLFKPKKNRFDLTHDVKMSLDMGEICPIVALECVPGDTFNISCESLLRFAPLVAPVMHRFDVTMHYFFVPNRLVWSDWENFIMNKQETPGTAGMLLMESNEQKLADYLGIPPIPSGASSARVISNAIPFAAYQMIYNEYYRDQNLIDPVNFQLVTGDNSSNADLYKLRRRAWQHDYFTAALPFAQKGDPVVLPLGEAAQVKIAGTPNTPVNTMDGTPYDANIPVSTTVAGGVQDGKVYADLTTATAASINDLRRAFRLQEWLEKNARAGTRYIENILGHFGERSADSRLQRPEYITGVKSPVVISEVLNTTGEDGGLPQGNMSGHAVGVTSGKYGRYHCSEHGYIIGVMSVLPVTAYQQGMPKHFIKEDFLDYYWPSFAHLGEQEVKQVEIWADDILVTEPFGYVPRYSEYKYHPSRVAGDFRTTLDYWHMGRIFSSSPSLNQEFVECNPGKRIFAVESTENSLYAQVLNKIEAFRPMPKFGTPMF